ncbi:hypothetical protein ACEPAF_494 [Sanghuangporus sanghuang]
MKRTCLGDLARLVDDTILKALCLCDIIDLIHAEQTCRYLRHLVSDSEVWHAVALGLPRELFPSILPGQTREETDVRTLALRALRGYKNWTSDSPKPIWRRAIAVERSHCLRMLTDPQLLPGGRFFLYFADETLYCFDVDKNKYLLERKNPFLELLGSGFELRSDKNILTICLIGRSHIRSVMVVKIELSELDLQTGNCVLLRKIMKPWSDLCEGAGGEYIMLKQPIVNGQRTIVPYFCVDTRAMSTRSRDSSGAMIVDFSRNSILLLSLRSFSGDDSDLRSSVAIAGSHLLFAAGLGSSDFIIRSLSLAQFESCWQTIDGEATWTHYNVQPEHIDGSLRLHLSTPSPPNLWLSTHASTWLDRESARRRHPSVISVSLVDVAFSYREGTETMTSFHQLQFAEVAESRYNSQSSAEVHSRDIGIFIAADQGGSPEYIELPRWGPFPLDGPTRTGRIVAETKRVEGGIQVMARHANMPEWRPLHHLTGRRIRHVIQDYYTGIVLHSSQTLDPETSDLILSSAEMVLEGYDG